jgi:tetratricopeptide (TPR) repeat protein
LDDPSCGTGFQPVQSSCRPLMPSDYRVLESSTRQHGLEARATGQPSRHLSSNIALALGVGLITLAVFSPILPHGFVDGWDDDTAITHNPDFNPPRVVHLLHYWVPPPKDQFYVPVTYTVLGFTSMVARSTTATGAAVFNAAPFHAISLVAHALSAMLVFLILVQLVEKRWAAFIGALVFALHPIQTEAVAWASTSYTPMCGMFGLAAVWQFLHYSQKLTQQNRRPARIHYAWASLFFLLAMLTKPAAASVPLIIAAIEIGWRRRRALSLALPLGTWIVLSIPIILATKMGAPANTVGHFELWQRVIIALDAIAFYLYKIIWPAHLNADYGRSPNGVLSNPMLWWTCLIPVAIFVAARLLRVRAPWFGAAAGVFAAGLLPTLGFASFDFQTFSTVADRFTYLAMLGIAMPIAAIISPLSLRRMVPLAVAILAGLGTLSVLQAKHWQNAWTLFAYTIETRPESKIVGSNIRFMLTPQLEEHCTLSPVELVHLADLLVAQRRTVQAAAICEMAIERGAHDSVAYDKYAEALLENEKLPEAEQAAHEALRLNPNDAAAHATLGNIYIRDDLKRAQNEFRQALALDPNNVVAKRALAATGPDK